MDQYDLNRVPDNIHIGNDARGLSVCYTTPGHAKTFVRPGTWFMTPQASKEYVQEIHCFLDTNLRDSDRPVSLNVYDHAKTMFGPGVLDPLEALIADHNSRVKGAKDA